MKLVLRTVDGANLPGGRALVLCDEHGAMLPGQTAIELVQEEDASSVITVSFKIDGFEVILDGTPIDD